MGWADGSRADVGLVQWQSAFARRNGLVVGSGDLDGTIAASIRLAGRDFDTVTLNIRAGHGCELGRTHSGTFAISAALSATLIVARQTKASWKHVGGRRDRSAGAWLLDAEKRITNLGIQFGCDFRGDVRAVKVFGALIRREATRRNLFAALRRNVGSHVLVHPQRATGAWVHNAFQGPISRVARWAGWARRSLGGCGALYSSTRCLHLLSQLNAAFALRNHFLVLVQHSDLTLVATVGLALRWRSAVAPKARASPLCLLCRALSLEETIRATVGISSFAWLSKPKHRGCQNGTARAHFLGANELLGDFRGNLGLHVGRNVITCIAVRAVGGCIANLQGSSTSAGGRAHVHRIPSPLARTLILDAHEVEVSTLWGSGSAVGGSHVWALDFGAHISRRSHLALVSNHNAFGILHLQTA